MIAGQRQFIAAARAGPLDRRDILLPGIRFRGFKGVPGLIGELAKIHLMRMGRAAEHANIGAGAKHIVLAGSQNHDLHFRVLKAHPLNDIGQLDINPQIVGIQL